MFVDVVIPLAVQSTYTYSVPEALKSDVSFGKRVEVSFGRKKLYAALIVNVHHKSPDYPTKPILSVLDENPVFRRTQYDLWKWLSNYYMSSMGAVMYIALPSLLKLHSETYLLPGPHLEAQWEELDNDMYMLAEALTIQNRLRISDVQDILQKNTVYPLIKEAIENGLFVLEESLIHKYKPKLQNFVQLNFDIGSKSKEVLESLKNAPKQTEIVLALMAMSQPQKLISKKDLGKRIQLNAQAFKKLVEKQLVVVFQKQKSRIEFTSTKDKKINLSAAQQSAHDYLDSSDKNVALLHGVTGSGKTEIYCRLIEKQLSIGKQVLFLVPEIALTTQLVHRLRNFFGDKLLVYHSRINESKRLEIWHQCMDQKPYLIVGARSSLFLPFFQLGLIVVDEEHDPSYRQYDPAPRYSGRDLAIVLANIHSAKVILGSATPSMESYWNAKTNKYAYYSLQTRFQEIPLPQVHVEDMSRTFKQGASRYLSTYLTEAIERNRNEGYQTILFQNRRGFAPIMFCTNCNWVDSCVNCDISLTYHKYQDQMQCHLCGHRHRVLSTCKACGKNTLEIKGLGTEQLEEEVKTLFPDYKIARLDLDTARGQKKLNRILERFAVQEIDILIGTQMVSKGLDFDHVGLVGIVSADQLMYYPDFRAAERAFQLMVQVSGRAGRKHRRGEVIVQTYSPHIPLIKEVVQQDYNAFFNREIIEREQFGFPPFVRLIKIICKHKKWDKLDQAAKSLDLALRPKLRSMLMGPAKPSIGRIRNEYLLEFLIKIPRKSPHIKAIKELILKEIRVVEKIKGLSTIQFALVVDP